MTDITPYQFIKKVWQAQPTGTVGFVSIKDWSTGGWQDLPVDLPLERGGVPKDKDLYFAPVLFKESRRLKQHACGGVWLFADLDEVDPRSLGYLPPQVAWETSPGRYQALWRLEKPLGVKAFERLNRAVTYRTGADRGGWSATKVLRVPGSTSTKHGFDFDVALVLADWEGRVDAAVVRRVCSKALPASDPATGRIHLPKASAREIRRTHWAELSPRARKLIRAKVVHADDDRSARLWELENLCLDAGMTPGETVKVVRETVWNKFKGQRREMRMLLADTGRAEAQQRAKGQVPERRRKAGEREQTQRFDDGTPEEEESKPVTGDVLPSMSLRKFMARSYAPGGWLVEDIWDSNAFGWWAGEFKAYKTWTILDFAVSVAAGVPFLGRYMVKNPGHVLYLHDEGKPNVIQDQLHRILDSKGMTPSFTKDPESQHGEIVWDREIPLRVSTMPLLDLTKEKDRQGIVNYIQVWKPRVVILEAWYLVTGEADEKEATDVNPIARWLMKLTEEEKCAIIVSHHYNKGSGQGVRAGNRLSGSGVFGRVFESAVYLERKGEEEDHTVQLESQHRAQEGTKTTMKFSVDRELDEDYRIHFLTEEEMAGLGSVQMPGGNGAEPRGQGRSTLDLGALQELSQGEVLWMEQAMALTGASQSTIRRRFKEQGPEAGFKLMMKGGRAVVVGV